MKKIALLFLVSAEQGKKKSFFLSEWMNKLRSLHKKADLLNDTAMSCPNYKSFTQQLEDHLNETSIDPIFKTFMGNLLECPKDTSDIIYRFNPDDLFIVSCPFSPLPPEFQEKAIRLWGPVLRKVNPKIKIQAIPCHIDESKRGTAVYEIAQLVRDAYAPEKDISLVNARLARTS